MAAVVQRKGRIAMKGVKGMDEAQDQAPQTGAEGGHDNIGKLQVRRLLLVRWNRPGCGEAMASRPTPMPRGWNASSPRWPT